MSPRTEAERKRRRAHEHDRRKRRATEAREARELDPTAPRATHKIAETDRRKRRAAERRGDVGQFVAIDSEGADVGEPFELDGRVYRDHRTFLWLATASDGHVERLYDGGKPLSSEAICRWLQSLPRVFPRGIFIMFASSYDITQALRDLPYAQVRAVSKHKNDDEPEARMSTKWECGPFAISYVKGKWFRLSDKRGPCRRSPDGKRWLKPSYKRNVEIYDVFSYFQTSFLAAIKGFPECWSPEEYAIIERGKKQRVDFRGVNIATVIEYTTAELRVLARIMTRIRDHLAELDIRPKRWHGPGTVASLMLETRGVLDWFPTCTPSLENDRFGAGEYQSAAHHAFFGGRIDLHQQGVCTKLYNYDISSAYPAIMAGLPQMLAGNLWHELLPNVDMVHDASAVSIFRVEWRFDELARIPFYPLPYRTDRGAIYYPPQGHGWYMAEEIRAALEWQRRYGGKLDIVEAWIWEPSLDVEPCAFLRELYVERQRRAAVVKETGVADSMVQILKLALNSAYGKTAQKIGERGRVPKTVNPWYAAAITAGTRAQMLRAMLVDHASVVLVATDGLFTTRPIGKMIGANREKILGTFEDCEPIDYGVFVQPGVYSYGYKRKTRGMSIAYLPEADDPFGEFLKSAVLPGWKRNTDSVEVPYNAYITIGSAVASERRFELAGHWVTYDRTLDLRRPGTKRMMPATRVDERARAETLVPCAPYADILYDFTRLSEPSLPNWLDDADATSEDDTETIVMARYG